MAEHPENYEDVTVYTLDDDDERELLDQQNECTFMWSNKEGWPVGVIMSYFFDDGRFWLTASRQRARVPAVRRDPRVAICVTSAGTDIRAGRTVTYKGTCEVLEDRESKDYMYPRLAEALYGRRRPQMVEPFVDFLDSPRRVVLAVTPTQRIGYDGFKMRDATAEWMAARQDEAAAT